MEFGVRQEVSAYKVRILKCFSKPRKEKKLSINAKNISRIDLWVWLCS